MNTKTDNTQKFYFADLNDSQKQDLASKIVDREIYSNETQLVEYVLKQAWEDSDAPFSYDDITNNGYYGEVELSNGYEELTESERDEKLEMLEEALEAPIKLDIERIKSDIEILEDMDFDQSPEIYQWFSCSKWLANKLEELGQCILDDSYWGRQCCGQAIYLDHVIQKLAFDWECSYSVDYLTLEQVEAI